MNQTKVNTQAADEFANCVKTQLNLSEQQLPATVVSKLRQAREQALQQEKRNKFDVSTLFQYRWVASCASLLTVAIVVGYLHTSQLSVDKQLMAMDAEADILFADDSLDLYEDLEFYRWLANTGY